MWLQTKCYLLNSSLSDLGIEDDSAEIIAEYWLDTKEVSSFRRCYDDNGVEKDDEVMVYMKNGISVLIPYDYLQFKNHIVC